MLHRSGAQRALATIVACGLLVRASPAAAEETLGTDVGLGVLSAVCTLAYTPLKIAYASGGTVIAGLVFMWSVGDTAITKRVLRTTAGGDYVITREHLRGLRVLEIAG